MDRLTDDICKHQAEGAVGMHIDMGVEDIEYELNKTTYHDLLAHFVAMGTSIVHNPHSTETKHKSPLLYLNLATGKSNQLQVDHSE